jgi:hypothetical protein
VTMVARHVQLNGDKVSRVLMFIMRLCLCMYSQASMSFINVKQTVGQQPAELSFNTAAGSHAIK